MRELEARVHKDGEIDYVKLRVYPKNPRNQNGEAILVLPDGTELVFIVSELEEAFRLSLNW